MRAAGVSFAPMASPYGDSPFAFWWCDCTFDEKALRARLGLASCVEYREYNGMAAGADASFSCREHHVALLGPHPSFAGAQTPRVK